MVGYSANSKAYRVYNESTGIVEETYGVELDESNGRYGGIDGNDDEEEQRRAMKKMPKGEIKPKEDEKEIVDQIGPSSTLEEDDEKPPTTQDVQVQEPSSQNEDQVQVQESPTRIVTQDQATPQASTSRPRTRQQTSIEAQGCSTLPK